MKVFLSIFKNPLLGIIILFTTNSCSELYAQLSPQESGYIDAVVEFGVINDGQTVTTASLQAAIDASIKQDKGLYLQPGEYLIDNTLKIVDTPERRDDQSVVIQGSSVDPNNRSVLVLQEGSFTNPDNPQSIVVSEQIIRGYTDIVNRNIQSVDFRVEMGLNLLLL